MTTKVVLEPIAPDHDPALYRGTTAHADVHGFAAISGSAIARFREQGFLHVIGAFEVSLVTAARRELEAMAVADDPGCAAIYYEGLIRDHIELDPTRDRGSGPHTFALGQEATELPAVDRALRASFVRKFDGFIDRHPPLAALAEAPQLLEILEQLIGGPTRVFQDMALVKPPGGREKPWHQDHAYFNFPLTTPIVGVWIPLHDVDATNGCMHLLPGAHKEGPQAHFARRDWQICDTDIYGRTQVAVPMRAGDLLLFDAKLPHGTPTNRTDEIRWAVQYHYVPRDAAQSDDAERLAAFGTEGKDVTC